VARKEEEEEEEGAKAVVEEEECKVGMKRVAWVLVEMWRGG
jgi:hypothetical protein